MASRGCWKHQILPSCAFIPSAYRWKQRLAGLTLALLPCRSAALAVVMGTRYAFNIYGNSYAEGDCCAVAIHILVGQLGFGHGSSLYNTDWHGKGGVSGVSVCASSL